MDLRAHDGVLPDLAENERVVAWHRLIGAIVHSQGVRMLAKLSLARSVLRPKTAISADARSIRCMRRRSSAQLGKSHKA
jgi:hypothetical protein